MLAWLFVHLPQIGITVACLTGLSAFVGGTTEHYEISTRWSPQPRGGARPVWTEPTRGSARRHRPTR